MLIKGRAHALYSPCRPVPVKKRFLQSLSAGRRTRMRIQPDYDWADGQRRLSQKKTGRQDSGMQRLHCSLLPMKTLTYKGTAEKRGSRTGRAFVPRNGPGVWQRRTIPGRKLPRKAALAAPGPGGKETPLVEPLSLCSRPAIGYFIRKPVAGSGVNAAKRLPLLPLGKAEGMHLRAGSPSEYG